MREILFRGFHKNPNGPDTVIIGGNPVRGKWVYGFSWKNIWGDGESCYILYDGEDYPVIPASVGQYTGLTDKNGVKIFEGDILEHHIQGDILVNKGVVEWDDHNGRWTHRLNTMSPSFYMCNSSAIEGIGNIHDNPELLKGGDEG